MSGPKRNEDSLNIIGIVVVGITSAVMVYVSITALQAFYMNDTSELQTMQDYGGQDTLALSHKATEMGNITNPQTAGTISIDHAMDLIVADADAAAKAGKPADHLVPQACESTHATEKAQPGRPVLDTTLSGGCKGGKVAAPPPAMDNSASGSGSGSTAAPAGNGSAATPAGKGSGSAAAPAGKGSGSAAAGGAQDIHLHANGSPADTHRVGGGGGAPEGNGAGSAKLVPGGHAP